VGHAASPSTVSDLNKKIYGTIEAWRNRPFEGEHPYVYFDGIVLKRSWAGEVRNVSLLVAIAVNGEGYREILGICEGAKARHRYLFASLPMIVPTRQVALDEAIEDDEQISAAHFPNAQLRQPYLAIVPCIGDFGV
jgi:Transposase, Mutator family